MRLASIILAYLFDLSFGDPRWFPHPVKGIGYMINRLENLFYPMKSKRLGGLLLALVVIGASFSFVWILVSLSGRISPVLSLAVSSFFIYTTLSVKDLKVESKLVFQKLKEGDLEDARQKLSLIVGRDTGDLSHEEIVRATVESIAESIVDGIISPLFFAFVGGAPLAIAYKAVNTLDSMVGSRSERYRDFGFASARLDELLNYIPARMSSVLLPISSLFCGVYPVNSIKTVFRDTRFFSDENSYIPEAAMAGALGVQLGGLNYYQSKPVHIRPMGQKINRLNSEKIVRANRIMYVTSFLAMILGTVAFLASFFLCSISCAEDEFPITVKDGLGREVTVHAAPKRIASTIPSNTEILYDLGLKDKVVAVTSHCGQTCDISGKDIIGGWSEPAIAEKIESLHPDLVLAFGGLQSPLAEQMENRGIPTFVFFPKAVDEILEQILLVGKITGTASRATSIVARCENRLREIADEIKDIPYDERLSCLRLMSTEAMVIGGGSFQNDIIKKAGGINIFRDIEEDYPIVSLEDVKEKDPDMIIFNRDDEEKAIKWFLEQEGWRDLRAARERRLMSISCDYICHPNTRIDKTVEMLARRFYPDRFTLPRRIVSLSPAVTESIYLMGAGDVIVGNTIYCQHPPQAKLKDKVGTVINPNIEKILSLQPDLVLSTDEGINTNLVKRLDQLGIRIRAFESNKSFEDICDNFLILGDLIGRRDTAFQIVERARSRVAAVEAKVKDMPKVRVFWEIGARPLVTVAKGTFTDDLISLSGGENIASEYNLEYPPLSREEVLRQNPEVIILVTMGDVTESEMSYWSRFGDLGAARHRRIYVVDEHKFCCPTPVSFADGVEEVAGLLHPGVFGGKGDTSPIGTGPGPRLAGEPVPDWQQNRSPIGSRTGPRLAAEPVLKKNE